MRIKNFLVTGAPGSGKSSVIARTADLLRSRGLRPGGIICPEIREGGTRIGFRMEDISTGEKEILAHVNIRGGPSIGKYGVNIEGLDRMSREAIGKAVSGSDFVIIDEIGPMEVLSTEFRRAVAAALDSEKPVIAAVHMRTAGGFIGSVKSRKDARIIQVDRENRDRLPHELAEAVERAIRGGET
ncbi:MAG: NTPase [Candidatus Hadarchaeales archaeon]